MRSLQLAGDGQSAADLVPQVFGLLFDARPVREGLHRQAALRKPFARKDPVSFAFRTSPCYGMVGAGGHVPCERIVRPEVLAAGDGRGFQFPAPGIEQVQAHLFDLGGEKVPAFAVVGIAELQAKRKKAVVPVIPDTTAKEGGPSEKEERSSHYIQGLFLHSCADWLAQRFISTTVHASIVMSAEMKVWVSSGVVGSVGIVPAAVLKPRLLISVILTL